MKLTDEEYNSLEEKEEIEIERESQKYIIGKSNDSIHYAKRVTPTGKFVDWITAPKNKDERINIKVGNVSKHYKLKEPYCFFCNRKRQELGIRETLTVDHILELNEGGEDKIENTQILCSACHKLKLWYKTYILYHLIRKKE